MSRVHLNHLTAPALLDTSVLKTKVEGDEILKEIIAKFEKGEAISGFTMQQGMLRYKGRLVISKNSTLLPTILHTYHDSVFRGHSGYLRTYKRLTGELYWEGMKADVQKYCEKCLTCQCNKTLALSPIRLLVSHAPRNTRCCLE